MKDRGRFTIGGAEGTSPTIGAAVSKAQYRACSADKPIQLGVFDNGDKVARVERHENGVVTTTMLDGDGR